MVSRAANSGVQHVEGGAKNGATINVLYPRVGNPDGKIHNYFGKKPMLCCVLSVIYGMTWEIEWINESAHIVHFLFQKHNNNLKNKENKIFFKI